MQFVHLMRLVIADQCLRHQGNSLRRLINPISLSNESDLFERGVTVNLFASACTLKRTAMRIEVRNLPDILSVDVS